MQGRNKIKILDLFPVDHDRRGGDLENAVIHVLLAGKHRFHDLFVRLGIQTAAAVIDRSQRHLIRLRIIEETPVAVMPVPVANQCIYNEHIPESLCYRHAVNCILFLKGVKNIGQFRAVAAALRVNDLVFQGGEIL